MLNAPATGPLRFIVLAIDEKRAWVLGDLPAEEQPDRIVATYLTSPDVGVHLCEITPSCDLRWQETHAEWDRDVDDAVRERVDLWIMDHNNSWSENDCYMHRSDVLRRCKGLADFLDRTGDGVPDRVPEAHYRPGAVWAYVDSVDEYNEENIDAVRETVQGHNPLA